MDSLIKKLLHFKNSVDLNERYDYQFDFHAPFFSDQEIDKFDSTKSIFKRSILLKELIKDKVKGSFNNTDINFWIINEWGGIKSFKRTDSNIQRISTFSEQLYNHKLTIDTFGTISSLSKISSFVNPDNFVIYDSRVIYSLNWLILTTNPEEIKFFPMPLGRNKKLNDFDINTIINLINLDKYNRHKSLFYDHQTAYFKFCDLIKSTSKIIFDDKAVKPYYLEMLLFTIADDEIYKELTLMTKIKISY
jgi:hypothetical protein